MATADSELFGDGELMVSGDGELMVTTADGEKKRRSKADWEEAYKKVKKTIGWYNHHGGLTGGQIMYKNIKDVVEQVDPRESLKILKHLETQGTEIKKPTAWFRSQMFKVGLELPSKVKKVITWFNNQGKLVAPIQYSEVRKSLSLLSQQDQLKIINGLEGKEEAIADPTTWICAAAVRKKPSTVLPQPSWSAKKPQFVKKPQQRPDAQQNTRKGWGSKGGANSSVISSAAAASLDMKVKKTLGWYNKSGLLQQEIRFDEVADALNAIGVKAALDVLKGLETKGPQIRNPSAWIVKATQMPKSA